MDSITRWTGISALILSAFSLGMSGWVVGCGNKPSEPSSQPSEPRAQPIVTAVQHAAPIASITGSTASAPASVPSVKPSAPEADAKQSERPAAKHERTSAQVRVKRLVVTRKVEDREPAKDGPSFSLDGAPLYAFVEMENRTEDAAKIVITFEKAGTSTGHIELGVPANQSRWRTWGLTRGIRDAGEWVAVVRTVEGAELARVPFAVTRRT